MSLNLTKLPASLREVEKNHFYTMDYPGDYKLDEFMKTGVDSDHELARFIRDVLLEGQISIPDLPHIGCSCYAGRLACGDRIFGRNFDVSPAPCMMLRTRPSDGYASLSMVNLEYCGLAYDKLPMTDALTPYMLSTPYKALDGLNEKGLAIGVLSAKDHITDQHTGKIGVTTTSAIRIVLDRCATVQEAVEMLRRFDMHQSRGSNYHFQITDALGGSVVVEYANGQMYVWDARYVTNFFLTPGIDKTGCGRNRYEILKRFITETDGVFADMNAAMEPLKQASEDGTRWSAVYNMTDLSVLMSLEHNFTHSYTFRLNDPSL